MKVHHATQHGESLAGFETECAWCGDSMRVRNREHAERDSLCSDECLSAWTSDRMSGSANHNWFDDESGEYPWRDENRLREMYCDDEMNLYEIVDEFDCDPVTVHNWMERFGIDRRSASESQRLRHGTDAPVSFKWHRQGYPTAYFNRDHTYYEVRIHRLAAVAWFGWDAVVDRHVHHENGVPWDNREENLKPMTPTEHAEIHTNEHDRAAGGQLLPTNEAGADR